jgi:hypothetical protein
MAAGDPRRASRPDLLYLAFASDFERRFSHQGPQRRDAAK